MYLITWIFSLHCRDVDFRWESMETVLSLSELLAGDIQNKVTCHVVCANANGGGRLQLFCYKHESGVRSLFPGYVTAA